MVLHLGDCYDDKEELRLSYDFPVHGVLGNVDYEEGVSTMMLDVHEIKIFICHGHQFRVKSSLEVLKQHGRSLGADVILFGHTHTAYYEEADLLLFNPGSITFPRNHEAKSYGILEINQREIKHKIIYLK